MQSYAAVKDPQKPVEDLQPQIHRIRITLTSTNVKSLEKGTSCLESPFAGRFTHTFLCSLC